MNDKKRIDTVTIKRMIDEHGEADHLGAYSQAPGPADRTVNRQERGDWKPGEYRYFIAAMSGEETGNPDSVEQDYKRMEAGMNGEWCLMGIRAEAIIHLTGDLCQKITSGALWGVESDGGEEYFKELENEQLDGLKGELLAIGFTEAQIREAFENVTHENAL